MPVRSMKQNSSTIRQKRNFEVTHGFTNDPVYVVWAGMNNRCYNPNQTQFKDYGGRGISICGEWRENPRLFKEWAYQNGYQPGLDIDRKDNDGDYSPENCRFVTRLVNNNNKRNNRFVTCFGETKTYREWGRDPRCVVPANTLRYRLRKMGLSPMEAMTTPVGDV